MNIIIIILLLLLLLLLHFAKQHNLLHPFVANWFLINLHCLHCM